MTAMIVSERDFLIRGIDRAYDGLTDGQQQQALDFMRALQLANTVDQGSTGELMNAFHPSDKTDVHTAYEQLLRIVQSTVDSVLNKRPANDD